MSSVRITNLRNNNIAISGRPGGKVADIRLSVGAHVDLNVLLEDCALDAGIAAAVASGLISIAKIAERTDTQFLMPVAPDSDGFVMPIHLKQAIVSGGTTGTREDVVLKSSLPFGFIPETMTWYPSTVGATRTKASTAYSNVSNVQTITVASGHGMVKGEYVTFDTVTAGGDVATATPILRTTATTVVIANAGANSATTEAGTITVNPTVQLQSKAAYQVASTAYANVSNVQTITVASHSLVAGDSVIFDTVTAGGDVLTATPVISTTATTVVIANAGANSSATEAGMLTRVPTLYSSSIDSSGSVLISSTLAVPVAAAAGTSLVLAKSDRNAAGLVIIRGSRT